LSIVLAIEFRDLYGVPMPQVATDLTAARPIAARVAISAIFLACGMSMGVWATQIARLKVALALSDRGISAVVLAFACGSIPMMPLAGSLAARWGNIPSIGVASVATAATLALLGMAPTFVALLVAAALAGAAVGGLDVTMNAHATSVSVAWRKPILSSIHGWFSLGGLFGGVVSGALTGAGFSIAFVMAQTGATMLLTGMIALPFLALQDEAHEPGPGFVRPTSAMLGIGLLCLLSLLIEGGIVDWTTVYLHESTGASISWSAAGISGFSVAMAIGRFLGDPVVRRCGNGPVMTASGVLAAIGLGMAVAFPTPVAATAGFVLTGFGMANIVPLLFAAAGRVPGVKPAVGVAMAATIGYGAFLMGPPLIGFLAGAVGLRFALIVLVASAVGIAIGGLIHGRRRGEAF
jgi:fucose permease